MKNSRFPRAVATLALCAIALPSLGSEKTPVTRPFKTEGHFTLVLNLLTGTLETQNWGEATHVGRFCCLASGTMDPVTGRVSGTSHMLAANGDELYESIEGSLDQATVTFTGGTGRFKNASGSYLLGPASIPQFSYDWVNMTMTMTCSVTGTGTITY